MNAGLKNYQLIKNMHPIKEATLSGPFDGEILHPCATAWPEGVSRPSASIAGPLLLQSIPWGGATRAATLDVQTTHQHGLMRPRTDNLNFHVQTTGH